MERPDEVLALGGVDPGLPADGRVHHREQGGRHLDDPDPAQPGGRDEPREVGHGAAADADDRVGPGEPGLAERAPELGGDGGALRVLGVGHHGEVGVQPGRAGGVGHLLSPDRERRRVDDEDPLDGLAEQGHHGVDDPVPDDHLVRVVAGPDGDAGQRPGHPAAPGPGRLAARAPAISDATSSGVRPAVSARKVATAS